MSRLRTLALYSLLRHFVEVQIGERPELALERASFDSACEIDDLLLLAKRGMLDLGEGATLLRGLVRDHHDKHKAAYGVEFLKPKSTTGSTI